MQEPITESVNVDEEQNIVASNSVYGFLRMGSKFFVSFLLSILLVRFLGPTNYGVYTVAVLYWGFASTFSSLGLGSTIMYGVARYRAKDRKGLINWVISHYFIVLMVSSSVASVALFAVSGPLAVIYRTPSLAEYIRILAIGVIFYSINDNFTTAVFTGSQKLKYGFITGVIYDVLRIVQLVVVYIGFGLLGAIAMYDVTYLVIATIGLFFVYRIFRLNSAKDRPEAAELSHLKHYSAFSYTGSLISTLYGPVITLFLGAVAANMSDVSFYRVGLIMVGMLGMPANIIGSAFFSSITKFFEKRDLVNFYMLEKRLLKYSVLITIPFVVASLISIRQLISYLYRSSFLSVQTPFVILIVPVILTAIFGPLTQILSATGKQKYWMYSVVAGAVVGLVSTLVLVPRFSAVGAAEAYTLVSITMLVLNLAFLNRLRIISFSKSIPYLDLAKGFVSAALMGIFLYYALAFVATLSLLPWILILSLFVYFGLLYATRTITRHDMSFFVKLLRADKFIRAFYKR